MKPLSRTFRSSTLWIMVVIFFVGTPILIGYSKGYRIGDALSLIETGGIYIHSDTANTTVYLNGEFVEENGAFLKNTLIQDLRPNKTYEVWVEKSGFQSWTKELTVVPNLVTEAAVLMLPDTFIWEAVVATSTVPLDDDVIDTTSTSTTRELPNPRFLEHKKYFADDRDQFMVEVATTTYNIVRGKRTASTTFILEVEFPDWLVETASTTALAEKVMVRERDGIVTWLEDGNVHALWARDVDEAPYYFRNGTTTRTLVIDWDEDILRHEFYPSRNDVVVIGSERGIYAVELDDRSQRNIQPIVEELLLDFRLLQDDTLVVFDGEVYRETSW